MAVPFGSLTLRDSDFSRAVTRRTAAQARFFGAIGGFLAVCDHSIAASDHIYAATQKPARLSAISAGSFL